MTFTGVPGSYTPASFSSIAEKNFGSSGGLTVGEKIDRFLNPYTPIRKDGELPVVISTVQAAAAEYYVANPSKYASQQSTPVSQTAFADGAERKNADEYKDFTRLEQWLIPSQYASKSQFSVDFMLSLGLLMKDPNGKYLLTSKGSALLAQLDSMPKNSPVYLPTLGMASVNVNYLSQLTEKDPSLTAVNIKDVYLGNSSGSVKPLAGLETVEPDKVDPKRLSPEALVVLESIYSKQTTYNATQVNLAIAGGLLSFDPKTGAISTTDQGKKLLGSSNKSDETSPADSRLAAQFKDHLGVIKNNPKYFSFNDPKNVFTWKKLYEIANGRGPDGKVPTEKEKAAAQFMLDNWDKPLLAPLRSGEKGDVDNKFNLKELEYVHAGLESVLAEDTANLKSKEDKKVPPAKRTVLQTLKEISDDKVFSVHQKNPLHEDRSSYLDFSDDFVENLLKSENPEYVKLGEAMKWLRDNHPAVWKMLGAGDGKVSKEDLQRVIAMLAPENFQIKKSDDAPK